ncbi:MAG TPA: response regulator [Rhodocyclaceae bacterium]|nr:response regulator [Rhodocyclaceae bacterium]
MAKAIDIGKFVVRFVEEARDHIGKLNDGLAALESGSDDKEVVNAVFRSAHTVKGSSRMLKLGPITDTAHKLEDVLGALREGAVRFDASLAQVLYRGVDGLSALVDKLAENSDGASLPPADAALLAALDAAAQGAGGAPAVAEPAAVEPATPSEPPPAPAVSAADPKLKTPDTVRVRLTKLDELIKLMGEVVSSHARMRQRLTDIRTIEREASDDSAGGELRQRLRGFAQTLKDDVLAQEALMDELHDKALIMRMLPLAIVFEPAGRMIREMARTVGKQVECVVAGAEIELDRQMIDKLSDPVIHLLRNAVDHGLETPEKRVAAGKTPQGRLSLSAHQDGGWVVIQVADDGGGIPIEAVRDKAIKRGFVTAEKAAAMSDQEVVDFIFLPGFSTSSIITDLSGRGVGMDVVKQTIVDDLQGVVGVETRSGAGTTFSLRLPLSLAVMRVVLVEVDGLSFGFTAQYVAEILRVPRSALLTVAERNAVVVRNEFVPVVPLAELLRVPKARVRKPATSRADLGLLLVVVRVRNEKIALEVDELIDERDMVIKPLPEHMRHLQTVSGMVITGRNELVSVLHAPTLLEQARKARGQASAAAAEEGAAQGGYRILVVDDSLNTREIEKDVLEAHGYRVTLAEDGLDGLRKAQAESFDAVLTDVEMPHMDGFSLTERLRQEEAYRSTPIVIITSREKEEDKRRGVQVGADAYIVKGDFDQSNLVDTLRALLG